jgi:hypothetical protein
VSDSTNGDGSPKQPQGESDKPQFVTSEQLNSAITARFKSLEKKVEESVGGMFSTFSTTLNETLTSKLDALKPPAPEAKEAKQSNAPAEPSPEMKALLAQVEQLKKANERVESERKAERAKARDITLRSQVKSTLTSAGIPEPLAKKAVFELVDGKRQVAFASDDSDSLMFRGDDGEATDLESGLRAWLSTDEAKFYKPATGATGSGDRSGSAKQATGGNNAALDAIARHFGLGQ